MFTKRDAGAKSSGRVQSTDHSPVNDYFHWSSASDIVIRGAVKPRPSWWGIRHRRPPQKLKAGFLLLDVLLPMRMRAPAQLAANGDSDQRTSLPPPLCDLTSVPNFELTVFDRHRGSGCPLTPTTPPCVRVRTRRFERVTLTCILQMREPERVKIRVGKRDG